MSTDPIGAADGTPDKSFLSPFCEAKRQSESLTTFARKFLAPFTPTPAKSSCPKRYRGPCGDSSPIETSLFDEVAGAHA